MRVVEVPKDLDKEAFAKKAQAIYDQKHREQMEATARGKVVAIEVESGEVFIGYTALEAAMKGRMKFPDKFFYFIRVGYPAVHCLTGTGKRVSVAEKT